MEEAARAIVEGYYQAINQGSVEKMVSYVSEDVLVLFPEESRNWQGIATATLKFTDMFKRNPNFRASFRHLGCERRGEALEVSIQAEFSSDGGSNERVMRYLIRNGKICQIVHV
eukprot:TRINITY_DN10383_c0_g1_i1.p2 TRINITY_DN10383_c0_g1~~TRINITY_DN10383_c0_g1_i1.p2  ORF type:complete len:114 (+),score=14.36 TRINITY_DN10383_c0_g1_i1:67-408(+)